MKSIFKIIRSIVIIMILGLVIISCNENGINNNGINNNDTNDNNTNNPGQNPNDKPTEPDLPVEQPRFPGMLTQTEFTKTLEGYTLPLMAQTTAISNRLTAWQKELEEVSLGGTAQWVAADVMKQRQGGLNDNLRYNNNSSRFNADINFNLDGVVDGLGVIIWNSAAWEIRDLFKEQAKAFRAAHYFKAWDTHSRHTTQGNINTKKAELEQAFKAAEDQGAQPIPRDNIDQAIAMLDEYVRTNMPVPADLGEMLMQQFQDLATIWGKTDIYSQLGYSTQVRTGEQLLQQQNSRQAIQEANVQHL